MTSKEISVIVRLLPNGEEVDMELPADSHSISIIEAFRHHALIEEQDDEEYTLEYKLVSKASGRELTASKTIWECGVKDGDTLLLMPNIVAKKFGKIAFNIPGSMIIGEKYKSKVMISRDGVKSYIKDEDIKGHDIKVELIEISEVMKCTLDEYSLRKHIEIIPITREEQFMGAEEYIEWRYDLYPDRIGLTTLVLKVSITKKIEGVEKHKDVFLFDKEVIINKSYPVGAVAHANSDNHFEEVTEIFEWNDQKKREVINFIQKGEIGQALAELANITQGIDAKFFNIIITLQAQLTDTRNKMNLGIIDMTEWLKISTKIVAVSLELIDDLDGANLSTPSKVKYRMDRLKDYQSLW